MPVASEDTDCIEYLITKANGHHSFLNNENKKAVESSNGASNSAYKIINNVGKLKDFSIESLSIYADHNRCHPFNNHETRLHNGAKINSKCYDINAPTNDTLSPCMLTLDASSDAVCINNVTQDAIKSNNSLKSKSHLIENLSVYLYPSYNIVNSDSNQINKVYTEPHRDNSKKFFSDSIPKIKAPDWSLMSRRTADLTTITVDNKVIDVIKNSADDENKAENHVREIKAHARSRSKLKISKQCQMNESKKGHEAQKKPVQLSTCDQSCIETIASKHATILPTPQHSPFLSTAGKSFHQFSPDVFIYRNIFPTLSFGSATTPFDNIVPSSPQKFSYAEKVAKLRAGGV